MTDQQPRYVANPNRADDSHRIIDNGYIKPPGVPLTEGRSPPGEQCAALGKAYNPGLGHAGGWTAHRMIDARDEFNPDRFWLRGDMTMRPKTEAREAYSDQTLTENTS